MLQKQRQYVEKNILKTTMIYIYLYVNKATFIGGYLEVALQSKIC